MSTKVKLLFVLSVTLLVGTLTVSNQSLWIDEGEAAMKALQPTVAQWWQALRTEGATNLQLLPHLFYLWAWEKIFGGSEISLRTANVPLLFGALAAAIIALQVRPRLQIWFALAALVNAFTWFYTGEARPYTLLFASSCVALVPLLRAYYEPKRSAEERAWYATLCAGLFMASATSFVAVPWAGAWLVTAIALVGVPAFLGLVRRHYLISLTFLIAMSALGLYFLWTLSIGARASSAVGRTGWMNLVFALYEHAGLAGLGPGRNDLRIAGPRLLLHYTLPLAAGAFALLAVGWQTLSLWRQNMTDKRLRLILVVAVVLPLLAVLCAGWVAHVRILGRHLTPLFPFVLFGLAIGLQRWWESGLRGRVVTLAATSLLLLSALQIRFAERHARDDYRSASALARQAVEGGRTVWWAADRKTGEYYRLALSGEQAGPLHIIDPSPAQIAAARPPDLIVLSKPDLYDPKGLIKSYAETNGYSITETLRAFQILEPRSR